MAQQDNPKLTITLSGRAPVTVVKDDWPVIASASDDSYSGDPGRWHQAKQRGECDMYRITVRQHADGRTIVYGVLDAAVAQWGAPAGGESYRGGYLLDAGQDAAAAIHRVADESGIPASVARACIADLPAEELV